ncbi:MAG: amino acid transporter [Corynebacterium sp.]|nr:amino acid transporter [Corynebacterium sp.]
MSNSKKSAQHPWWKVMFLTGVDYFSTLGYQPGIALVAAGTLAPIATVVLILVTLLGAVPVYRRIARESPGGEGSIAVLARFIHGWKGKIIILVLLGFAATDFMITMTLSAADASAHLLHNSESHWLIVVTLLLLAALAAVFFKGFDEAIGVSVVLVSVYLVLNAITIGAGFVHISQHGVLISDWLSDIKTYHPNIAGIALIAVIVFPKLALGLSGFETGVAVIPQINGDAPRGSQKLLVLAASIMSVFLLTSSIVVTLTVPQSAVEAGGPADGRALSYVAHELLGSTFGTVYDISTVAILWFAGASAMAGILNLIPRYLPKYGMAPEWATHPRHMVAVVTAVAFVVTLLFRANVDKQSAAYATGVLVLLTSGAFAVTLSALRDVRAKEGPMWKPIIYALITAVFIYTLGANIIERPAGLRVAAFFIVGIIAVSFVSRFYRSFETRTPVIHWEAKALRMIEAASAGHKLAMVANSGRGVSAQDYSYKEAEARRRHQIPADQPIIFLEVGVRDASEFYSPLEIEGVSVDGIPVLRCKAAAVPNAIAALAMDITDNNDIALDLYFNWSPGSPVRDMLRYLTIGSGQNAVVVHEIIRRAKRDGDHRPHVHVG